MRRALALVGLLLCALAGSQSVVDALRGSPTRLSVKDLPDGYRAVVLDDKGKENVAVGGTSGPSILATLADAILVDPQEFAELLDGKRPRIRGYAQVADGPAGPLFAETWIEGGRIARWSPRPEVTKAALLKAFPTPPSGPTPEEIAAVDGARAVAKGIREYLGDYDNVFPPAQSTLAARSVMNPYLIDAKAEWASKNPAGGQLLYNTSLARAHLDVDAGNPDIAALLLLWDERPWPDSGRIAAFVNGDARYVHASEWETIWTAELSRRRSRLGPPARPIPGAPFVPTSRP